MGSRRVSCELVLPALLGIALALAPPARGDFTAPSAYEHVVPRLSARTTRLFGNLRYEGNNRALRSPFDPEARRCADVERTRGLAARTGGLFVLRDALFSQQDHPIEQPSCALMLPANWVSAVVDDAMRGRVPAAVVAPAATDDEAWAALATPAVMFGGFQPSATLHGWAIRSRADASDEDRARIDNARAAVRSLASDAERLRDAADEGARAVAEVGAEVIAASDRAYFGSVRHDHVIPLFVENPSAHEIADENKGLVVHGRALDPEAIRLTREVVYRRRLAAGAMAIERYDITQRADVERAVEVLQMLVPKGRTQGHRVYVWVGGPLIEGTERVQEVHERLPEFLDTLREADIEMSRVTDGVNMTSFALRSMMSWR